MDESGRPGSCLPLSRSFGRLLPQLSAQPSEKESKSASLSLLTKELLAIYHSHGNFQRPFWLLCFTLVYLDDADANDRQRKKRNNLKKDKKRVSS